MANNSLSRQLVTTQRPGNSNAPGFGVSSSSQPSGAGKITDQKTDITLDSAASNGLVIIQGSFDSDDDAAENGVDIGGVYSIATADNEYGLPVGTLKKRIS